MSRVARVRTQINGGEQEAGAIQLVSGDFFSVFGVKASVGRLFTRPTTSRPVLIQLTVLSHTFWRRRFASAPDIVGRELTFNGARFTVIGVAAEGFTGTWLESPVDAWVPLAMQSDVRYAQNYQLERRRRPEAAVDDAAWHSMARHRRSRPASGWNRSRGAECRAPAAASSRPPAASRIRGSGRSSSTGD